MLYNNNNNNNNNYTKMWHDNFAYIWLLVTLVLLDRLQCPAHNCTTNVFICLKWRSIQSSSLCVSIAHERSARIPSASLKFWQLCPPSSICPMVKGLSHTPSLLLGTLFLSRSALLIMSLLSDPELNHTFSVLPTNCLNVSVVNCFPQSAVLLDEWVKCFVNVL